MSDGIFDFRFAICDFWSAVALYRFSTFVQRAVQNRQPSPCRSSSACGSPLRVCGFVERRPKAPGAAAPKRRFGAPRRREGWRTPQIANLKSKIKNPMLALVVALTLASAFGEEVSPQASFSIQERDKTAWLVRPNGERFFSFGVCCVSQGASRQEFDPVNPGYAAWQHYGDSNLWAEATLERLKAWGFTTVGGWSDFQALKHCRDANVAFAPVLHIGSTAGAPWWDMWDPKIIDRMHQVAREQILRLRDDPRVIGYYSDNEIGWWNGILFKMTLEQASTSGQRQRLLELLRQTYRNDWSELLRDFEPAPGVENWQELERHGMLFL